MDTALPQKFSFILDRNLAKANGTGNRVCTSCDTVVFDQCLFFALFAVPPAEEGSARESGWGGGGHHVWPAPCHGLPKQFLGSPAEVQATETRHFLVHFRPFLFKQEQFKQFFFFRQFHLTTCPVKKKNLKKCSIHILIIFCHQTLLFRISFLVFPFFFWGTLFTKK